MLITSSLLQLAVIKTLLSTHFEMTDCDEAKLILGIKVLYNRKKRTLQFQQARYIHDILRNFGMADATPVSTPLELGLNLLKLTETPPDVLHLPYHQIVGKLAYATTST